MACNACGWNLNPPDLSAGFNSWRLALANSSATWRTNFKWKKYFFFGMGLSRWASQLISGTFWSLWGRHFLVWIFSFERDPWLQWWLERSFWKSSVRQDSFWQVKVLWLFRFAWRWLWSGAFQKINYKELKRVNIKSKFVIKNYWLTLMCIFLFVYQGFFIFK